LFVAAGEQESTEGMLEPIGRLGARLKQRDYEGFDLTEMIIPGERHAGVKAEAFTRGLRALFTKPAVPIPSEELARYAGSYRSTDSEAAPDLMFAVSGTRLVLEGNPGSNDPDDLIAISHDRFRFAAIPAEITFHRDDRGEVTGATLHLRRGDLHLQRGG
jgi:hypothetical protein